MKLKLPGLSAYGQVSFTLRDVVTGAVERFGGRNTITPTGLSGLRHRRLNSTARWGEYSNEKVTNYFITSITAVRSSGGNVSKTASRTTPSGSSFPMSRTFTSVFAPGEATGEIVSFRGSANTTYDLPQPIQKGPNHELTVEWTVYLDFPQRVLPPVVLPGGQRDGTTDITVRGYIPNSYASEFIYHQDRYDRDPMEWVYFAGTSNEPSDIDNDNTSLKGTSLGSTISTTRVLRNQWNGPIGEIIVRQRMYYYPGYSDLALCRFTFDPPLDKTDDYELEFSWTYGDAVEVPVP